MIQLNNMTKQEFYKTHLEGKYFICKNDEEIVTTLSPIAKSLGKKIRAVRLKEGEMACTLDDILWLEWMVSSFLKGIEASLWIVKGIWDVEVENNVPSISEGQMVKLEDGSIYVISSYKGTLRAYNPAKDYVTVVDDSFLKKVTKVVNPEGGVLIGEFDSYKVVWSRMNIQKVKVFLGVSYMSPYFGRDLTATYLSQEGYEVVEWYRDKSEEENIRNIKTCDKLYLVVPKNFLENRTIGKGLYSELIGFLSNHSMGDVSVVCFNDTKVEIYGVSGYVKFKQPIGGEDYQNYATLKIKK